MSDIVFGVFKDHHSADQALSAIEREFGSREVSAFIHDQGLRDDELQIRGTGAVRGALMGAALVGVVGALVGGLILVPNAELSVGWTEWVFMFAAGTIFGVTAGAVAGASESREEIRSMANELGEDEVLVTMEFESAPSGTRAILEFLTQLGARRVQAT